MEQLKIKMTKEIDYDSILSSIKSNPVGKYIIEKLDLNDEDIKKNYALINAYIADNEPCFVCKSKKDCKHYSKGYQYNLTKDEQGFIDNCISICKFYESYYQKEKNLVYTTFNKDNLLDEGQKSFLVDNIKLLGSDFVKQIIKIIKKEQNVGAFLVLKDSKLRLKLIQSLANELLLEHKVMIVKFTDYIKEIKKDFKNSELLDMAFESEILIIDGLGSESISSWSRDEILLSILDSRLQSEKVTILCSEFDVDELNKIYRLNANDEAKSKQIINKIKEIINS